MKSPLISDAPFVVSFPSPARAAAREVAFNILMLSRIASDLADADTYFLPVVFALESRFGSARGGGTSVDILTRRATTSEPN